MIVRLLCLLTALALRDATAALGSAAHIHPELPLVQLKQHRHAMEQLEPDLANTIFDGVVRNPLARTTARPKMVRSPTLRGKRDTDELEIHRAEIKFVDDEDPFAVRSTPSTSTTTAAVETTTPQIEAVNETENEHVHRDQSIPSSSSASSTTTTTTLAPTETLIFEEIDRLPTDEKEEKVVDAQPALVTSAPEVERTTVEERDSVLPVTEDGVGPEEVVELAEFAPEEPGPELAELSFTEGPFDIEPQPPQTSETPQISTSTSTPPPLSIPEETTENSLQNNETTENAPIEVGEEAPDVFDEVVSMQTFAVPVEETVSEPSGVALPSSDIQDTEPEEEDSDAEGDAAVEEETTGGSSHQDELVQRPDAEREAEKTREADAARVEAPVPSAEGDQRPLLDSSVVKKRKIVSNYIDPVEFRKLSRYQKEAFLRFAATHAQRRIVRSVAEDEEIKRLAVEVGDSELLRVTDEVPDDLPTSTPTPARLEVQEVEEEPTVKRTTVPEPTEETTTPRSLTRAERLAALEAAAPKRKGVRSGAVLRAAPIRPRTTTTPQTPDYPSDDEAEAVKQPEDVWKGRSHLQLKLSETESREVVERESLSFLPRLVPTNAVVKKLEGKKAKPVHEATPSLQDLPQSPTDKDDFVESKVVVSRPTTPAPVVRPPVPTQPLLVPHPLSFPPTQPPPPQFPPQTPFFFPPPTPPPSVFAPQPPVQENFFVVNGQRFIVRSVPVDDFGRPLHPQPQPQPQPQFFAPPPPPPLLPQFPPQFQPQQFVPNFFPPTPSPPSPPPPPPTTMRPTRVAPSVLSNNGNPSTGEGLVSATTRPVHTGHTERVHRPRVQPEQLRVVRVFEHGGTTRAVFARPPSTTPATTTEEPRPTTTARTSWVPVTFGTIATPTPPFDQFLITTPRPSANKHVRGEDFDVYDELDPTTRTTQAPATSITTEAATTTTTTERPTTTSASVITAVDIGVRLPARHSETFSERVRPVESVETTEAVPEGIDAQRPPSRTPHPPTFDYLDDTEVASEKTQFAVKARKELKLVKLNFADADAEKRAPVRDFLGEAPMAKADLRGLDKVIFPLG